MMCTESSVSQPAENESGGNKRTPCSLHGCKRVYTDANALEAHMKDHENAASSAQSLPGKVMLCSTVGCGGSFPNMQKLMEHMRHHHKPNLFFLCESCRTKLRSYRGLLTHLHTCSKVPRGKTKPPDPAPASSAAATNQNMTPMAVDQNPPQLDSVAAPPEQPFPVPNPDGSFPAPATQPDSAAPPHLGPPFLPNPEPSPPQLAPPQLTEADVQPPVRNDACDQPPSLNPVGPAAAPDPPDAPVQQQQAPVKSPASAPHSPPGSTAVWKKNQGMACNRRILWEHTKGRYTCVQCGHSATNRKEMTQHINTQHNTNKPAEDAANTASST